MEQTTGKVQCRLPLPKGGQEVNRKQEVQQPKGTGVSHLQLRKSHRSTLQSQQELGASVNRKQLSPAPILRPGIAEGRLSHETQRQVRIVHSNHATSDSG